jgi:hypothetical protein
MTLSDRQKAIVRANLLTLSSQIATAIAAVEINDFDSLSRPIGLMDASINTIRHEMNMQTMQEEHEADNGASTATLDMRDHQGS